MKFNVLFNDSNELSLESYMNKCGIEDTKLYLNPVNMVEDWRKYNNIDNAVNLFNDYVIKKHIDKIYLLVDSDVDGYSSATMVYNYIRKLKLNINIEYMVHDGKQHGLSDSNVFTQLLNSEPSLIIIPDANSKEDDYKKLYEKGYKIIVLDHHESNTSEYATIVNCQFQDSTNHNASGSIVTHQFLRALDSYFGVKFAGGYTDLAMLGCVADVMQMNNYYNRAYFYYGSKLIKNPFLKYLIEQTMDVITPHNISFKIAPLINSVIRYDDYELKIDLFRAFIGDADYETVYKQCKKVHNYQKNTVKKISELIPIELCTNSKVIMYEADDNMPQSYSGLVAGKLSGTYNKPALVFRKVNDMYIGSGRSPIPIREQLADSGLFDVCNGHSNAWGVMFKNQNLPLIRQFCDSLDLTSDITHDVLLSYNEYIDDNKIFREFYGYDELWGNGIEKPLFAITSVKINSNNIKEMGSCHIKFTKGGVDFVKFFLTKTEKEKFKIGLNKNLIIDIVGTVDLNEFRGNITPQMIIEDYEIKERGEILWQELF